MPSEFTGMSEIYDVLYTGLDEHHEKEHREKLSRLKQRYFRWNLESYALQQYQCGLWIQI